MHTYTHLSCSGWDDSRKGNAAAAAKCAAKNYFFPQNYAIFSMICCGMMAFMHLLQNMRNGTFCASPLELSLAMLQFYDGEKNCCCKKFIHKREIINARKTKFATSDFFCVLPIFEEVFDCVLCCKHSAKTEHDKKLEKYSLLSFLLLVK